MSIESIKKALLKKRSDKTQPTKDFVSSGLTLLNLSLTGRTKTGLAKGCYYLFVGDSRAGKTFLALNVLAEVANNPEFDSYRLIYNAPEGGARMNMAKFFGEKMAKRLELKKSFFLEEFYYDLDDMTKEGTPYIAVLDSMDSLIPKEEADKFDEKKAAFRKCKEISGSYGTGKAKENSAYLRVAVNNLARNGSILIIISQTRDNIGFGSQFNPKTRSGGKALRYYATGEVWFSIKGAIKKTVRGKPRKIGSLLQMKVEKNRDTGREPVIEVAHYPDIGFDDTGSMIDFLVEEGTWKQNKTGYIESPWGSLRMDALVAKIEGGNLEKELRTIVAGTWKEIEEACEVKRKVRYS